MDAAREARAPLVHTRMSGTALFLATWGRRSCSCPRGMFLAPPTWPAANSSGSHTSMTIAFSRLMSCTACAALSEPAPAPLSTGIRSMTPEASARKTKYQLSRMKFTGVLGRKQST